MKDEEFEKRCGEVESSREFVLELGISDSLVCKSCNGFLSGFDCQLPNCDNLQEN